MLLLHHPTLPVISNIQVGEVLVSLNDSVRYLGVMFEKDLHVEDHIPSVNLHTTITRTCIISNHYIACSPQN